MKILFTLIFLVLFSGCNNVFEKEKFIEILSYRYEWNHNNKMDINYLLYAKIYPNGKTEVLRKYNFADNKAISFESKLEKKIIDSVFRLSSDFGESYYKFKYDSINISICDAPIIRIKINSKEKDFSFNFSECNKEEKYIIFLNLYAELEKKYLKEESSTTNHDLLLQKEKAFEKFVIHQDSLQLPFPNPPGPAPKINEVKFINPKSNSKLSP